MEEDLAEISDLCFSPSVNGSEVVSFTLNWGLRSSGPADPLTVPDGIKPYVLRFQNLVFQQRLDVDIVGLVPVGEGLGQVTDQRVLDPLASGYWIPDASPSGAETGIIEQGWNKTTR